MLKKIQIVLIILCFFSVPLSAQLKFGEADQLSLPSNQFYTAPTPSTDGTYLALSSAKYQGVYVYHFNTRQLKEVTNAQAAGWRMQWHPNEPLLAYRSSRNEGTLSREHRIEVYNVEQAQKQPVNDWNAHAPAIPVWDTSSNQLHFRTKSTAPIKKTKIEHFAVDARGAIEKMAVSSSSFVDFQQDAILRFEGDQTTVLYRSPDRQPILELCQASNGTIYFTEIGKPIMKLEAGKSEPQPLQEGNEISLSPDERYLLFSYQMDDGHDYLYSELVLLDTDDNKILDRFSNSSLLPFNPAWSADGRSVFFSDSRSGQIYNVQVNSTEE
jgi:Tol biopolymer transport system component